MRAMAPLVIVIALAGAPPQARAQDVGIDCTRAHWLGHQPAINVGHIFCGELRGRADGYHSEAIAPTPLVARVSRRQPIGRGLYDGRVEFADGEHKVSTFYPRGCSVAQIVASVRYAVAQPRTPRRGGWGFIAPSAPVGAEPGRYCTGDDGAPFTIRYGLLARGDVNTAFPDPLQ